MQTQLVKIKDLKNNTGQIVGLPKNPRILKDDKFIKLKKSLQDDPEMLELREVIAYNNNGELVVICGNMRLKVLKELGIKEVPTKILPIETRVEKLKAYTIKDNVSFGDHDWEVLSNEWDSEQLEEWGLDLPIDKEIDNSKEGDEIKIPKSLQVIPKKEYILIMADEDSEDWQELQQIFKCGLVRQGGCKIGSSSDKVGKGIERVFDLKTFKERVLNELSDSNTK
jgi:hypothetical protein